MFHGLFYQYKLYDQDNKNNRKVWACKLKKHPGYFFFSLYDEPEAE
ncbi:unnamed protein product [marine sediment metagenome]|uniref:Uncharacterized protein n=1 Tax=marine sediment metagenome TaxID=412755 RepID=X0YL05_9ZZZZ